MERDGALHLPLDSVLLGSRTGTEVSSFCLAIPGPELMPDRQPTASLGPSDLAEIWGNSQNQASGNP